MKREPPPETVFEIIYRITITAVLMMYVIFFATMLVAQINLPEKTYLAAWVLYVAWGGGTSLALLFHSR